MLFREIRAIHSLSCRRKELLIVDALGTLTGNMSYLSEYEEINGGYVAFGGDLKGCKITGKGKISTVLLRVPRKNNMYSLDLNNVTPSRGLTCLFAKATLDESNLQHRRLRHINFKTMNKLFYEKQGIKKELSVARTPQQNGVAKRKNRTLIEAARTITPSLRFMRPFRCPVTTLNTLDPLGKFDRKADEGFFLGYSMNNKAFRLFNSRTKIVEETLHITFLKNKPNVVGSGPTWLFDIDTLTKSMNYKPVVAGNQSNGSAGLETLPDKYYILLPLWTQDPLFSCSSKDSPGDKFKPSGEEEKKDVKDPGNEDNEVLSTEEPRDNVVNENIVYGCVNDPNMRNLEEIVYSDYDEDVDAEADMTNLDTSISVSPIPTTKIHKDHPVEQIIGDIHSTPQTRRMTKNVTNYEPKKGYTQEEGIDYDEVFALVARIKEIRLFVAYTSFKDFVVYQMDLKSAFLYGKIEEEVYVCQPSGFEDPEFPGRVYKVEKALYGLYQALRAWYETLSAYLLDNRFHKGLQVIQKDDGIFISQDKYVHEILKKFGFSIVKTTSTPIETLKPLMKDENVKDVNVYLYRSTIGSLMYLTSLMPDIMFVVCACARFQVIPKVSHLHARKRIFRYLKVQPKLGLWYPKDSPFNLEAYTDSDYAGASLDKKSTTGGCQFLRSSLISWQCKKQTVVANSTTKADYVAASNCYGQVLWIHNQMLGYGYNFMNTKIFIVA
uniref:Uncharacterized protein n=1 Tax=Tanacetum cinerariifolium TaxID=118510 RepID=A0A699I1X9_TANCI|nr:hypothetical protein [Tanacetum cinerariifolium]